MPAMQPATPATQNPGTPQARAGPCARQGRGLRHALSTLFMRRMALESAVAHKWAR